jgi:hypothetical protein
MHRGILSVTGKRSVTSVYGFDGALGLQLGHLAEALNRAGWKQSAVPSASGSRIPSWAVSLAGNEPPVIGIWKDTGPAAGRPDYLTPAPRPGAYPISSRARLDIDVSWATREDPIEPVAALITLAEYLDATTDFYRPVQVERSSARELISQALNDHPNVIAVRMSAMYYRNSNGPPC